MTADRPVDPNLYLLDSIVRRLGEIAEDLVFVGGCATGLLVTTPRAQSVRVTNDVDVVAEAATVSQYHAIEARLRKAGFSPDPEVICRWRASGMQLDVMPSSPDVLGFANRWYPQAIATALERKLPSGRNIRHVAGAEFLATKFEAFRDRGNGDSGNTRRATGGNSSIVPDVLGRQTIFRCRSCRKSPSASPRW